MTCSRRAFAAGAVVGALGVGTRAAAAGPTPPPPPAAWTRPRGLRPGDTIAFVAPAGPATAERVEAAKARFERLGFRVSVPPSLASRKDRYLAGTDAERADEFNAAVRDTGVQAVFAVKGGYGLTRILDRIDYAAVRANPKVIAGFSDLTALHLAIAKECRLVTFHSPMPQFGLWRDDGAFAYSGDVFWRSVRADGFAATAAGGYALPLPAGWPRPQPLAPGVARGRLVGGNLSLVAATVGTRYQVEPDGAVLVLEDTGEAAYRVDRMLSQLRLAGLLDRFAAVVLGTFDGADEKELAAVFAGYFGRSRPPVLAGLPIGHLPHNATFPHGGTAEVDAVAGTVRVLEPGVTAG